MREREGKGIGLTIVGLTIRKAREGVTIFKV